MKAPSTSWGRALGAVLIGMAIGGFTSKAAQFVAPMVLESAYRMETYHARMVVAQSGWFYLLLTGLASLVGSMVAGFLHPGAPLRAAFAPNLLYTVMPLLTAIARGAPAFAQWIPDSPDPHLLAGGFALTGFTSIVCGLIGAWVVGAIYTPEKDFDAQNATLTFFGIRWYHHLWVLPFVFYPMLSTALIGAYAFILLFISGSWVGVRPWLWTDGPLLAYVYTWGPLCLAAGASICCGCAIVTFALLQQSTVDAVPVNGWRSLPMRWGVVLLAGLIVPNLAAIPISYVAAYYDNLPKPLRGDFVWLGWVVGALAAIGVAMLGTIKAREWLHSVKHSHSDRAPANTQVIEGGQTEAEAEPYQPEPRSTAGLDDKPDGAADQAQRRGHPQPELLPRAVPSTQAVSTLSGLASPFRQGENAAGDEDLPVQELGQNELLPCETYPVLTPARLPPHWQQRLATCDLSRVVAELTRFFALADKQAAASDERVKWEPGFAQAWKRFSGDPSYWSAVRFLESDPGAAELWADYFAPLCASLRADSNASAPLNPQAMARARLYAGDYRGALNATEHALGQDPNDPAALSTAGMAHIGLRDFARAFIHLDRAIRVDPLRPEHLVNLGIWHMVQNQVAEAVEAYEAAIRLNPDFAPALTNLGEALEKTGNREDAFRAYQRAAAMLPSPSIAEEGMRRCASNTIDRGGEGGAPASSHPTDSGLEVGAVDRVARAICEAWLDDDPHQTACLDDPFAEPWSNELGIPEVVILCRVGALFLTLGGRASEPSFGPVIGRVAELVVDRLGPHYDVFNPYGAVPFAMEYLGGLCNPDAKPSAEICDAQAFLASLDVEITDPTALLWWCYFWKKVLIAGQKQADYLATKLRHEHSEITARDGGSRAASGRRSDGPTTSARKKRIITGPRRFRTSES